MPADTPIHPASTVVVLRDGPRGPEVFLVRRHHAVAFMAGAHVFRVGEWMRATDADASWCDGIAIARQRIGGVSPDESVAFHVAAARELLKRPASCCARTASGEFLALTGEDEHERFTAHRFDVNAGRRSFRTSCARNTSDWRWMHWSTSRTGSHRRSTSNADARFFVTRVPPIRRLCTTTTRRPTSMDSSRGRDRGGWKQRLGAAATDLGTLREIQSFVSVTRC